jgi:biopolymer transport protein ExbD
MAEMDTSSSGGHKKGPGVKKGKKLSTRVDLTPMVDLGFLLITFFMYTTTMAKPKTMQINMPYKDEHLKEEEQTKIKASVALTVLLSKDHRIFYYEGLANDSTKAPDIKVTSFRNPGGIRDVILNKQKTVAGLKSSGALSASDQVTVLIKPDTNSSYADMVNMLDEMQINDVRVYAIVDIASLEQGWIHDTEVANGIR